MIRTVTTRPKPHSFTLDEQHREMICDGTLYKFGSAQWVVFKALWDSRPDFLSRDVLAARIGATKQRGAPTLAAIGVHVYMLRQMLREAPLFIINHPADGYAMRLL